MDKTIWFAQPRWFSPKHPCSSLHPLCNKLLLLLKKNAQFIQIVEMPFRRYLGIGFFIVWGFLIQVSFAGWCTGTQCTPEVAVLNPNPTVSSGLFSQSIAIDGDYILSGMPAGSGAAGTVFVYYRNQGGWDNWGQIQSFQASDAASGMKFGSSVSLTGNLSVVGAPSGTFNSIAGGAAYVYQQNSSGIFAEVAKLGPSDSVASTGFGTAVSVYNDWIAVGRSVSNNANNAVYLYQYVGGAWSQTQKIAGTASTQFGASVWLELATLIIGVPSVTTGSSTTGATYVYQLSSGTWTQLTTLTLSTGSLAGGDSFGGSVTLSGDFVVVGAAGDDSLGGNSGAAYIFGRNVGGTSNWGMLKKFTGSTTQGGDNFGTSVTLYRGEYVIVGAPGKGSNIGAAYVYFRNQGGADNFGESAVLGSVLSGNNNYYGYSVTISADWVVVGAYKAGSGQAYVYRRTFFI